MAIGFNKDRTTEILLRLPVKSILRFKTVSKLWLSIASSPQFRQIHASRIVNRHNPIGLFTTKCPEIDLKESVLPLGGQLLPNTFRFLNEPINIKSSSGGLLLLQVKSCQSFNLQLRCDRDYFVCNPTTNEFKHLADLPQLIRDAKFVSETLAFDPSKSPTYKVVFLFQYHELDKEFQIVIYSSETQTFSSPPATTSTLSNFRFCGIYCYDAIHWISYDKSCFYYFHLKTELMKESPLPSNLFKFSQYFGESRGHLHLVTVFRRRQIPLLEVHELKSDYSGWSLKYQVDLDSMAKALPKSMMYSKSEMHSAIDKGKFTVFSIFVDKEEEENLVMVYLVCHICMAHTFKRKLSTELRFTVPVSRYDDRDRLVSRYDLRDKLYKGWPIAHQFIETLACVETHGCL